MIIHLDSTGTFRIDQIKSAYLGKVQACFDMAFLLKEARTLCYSEPWSLPGWLPNIVTWILNYFPGTRSISQVRVCPNGAVLKIEAIDRNHFLKAQSDPLGYESELLRVLNQRIPGACPVILPITPNPSSHVTEAVQGAPITQTGWAVALRDVARIQIESIGLVSRLDRAGVPHHNLQDIASCTEQTLNRLVDTQIGSANELTGEELKQIPSLSQKAAQDFESLCRSDLPETLVHGDLNPSNAFRTVSGTALVDWALSRITHPFFILASALFARYGRDDDRYHELCNVYLEPWRDFESGGRIEMALDAASRLFWIDSAIAMSLLCHNGHTRNLMNLPRFLRGALRAYGLIH
ncbi:MAG TPA: phosphotransferase [Terriglobales bacterium]